MQPVEGGRGGAAGGPGGLVEELRNGAVFIPVRHGEHRNLASRVDKHVVHLGGKADRFTVSYSIIE